MANEIFRGTTEAANQLYISVTLVKELCKNGTLKGAWKTSGTRGKWQIPQSAIDNYNDEQKKMALQQTEEVVCEVIEEKVEVFEEEGSDASSKTKSPEQIQTQYVIQDPLIEEARKKHNKDMLDILEEWENGLRNINPQVNAIWKELSGRGFYKDKFVHVLHVNVNNQNEVVAHFFIEEQRLFKALIVHLHGDNLWRYWHDYKQMLFREMSIVMQMTAGDEQRRAVLELHYKINSTKCIDRLEELRLGGVVATEKLCRYCPGVAFNKQSSSSS